MAQVELIMPKMGESIMEATILKWLKKEGDSVAADESVLEIATDKVDSEVPSPFAGVISKLLFKEGDVVEVGKAIAVLSQGGESSVPVSKPIAAAVEKPVEKIYQPASSKMKLSSVGASSNRDYHSNGNGEGRFFSPLVLNIARKEGISMAELEKLPGTGLNSRVTKKDILNYVTDRISGKTFTEIPVAKQTVIEAPNLQTQISNFKPATSYTGNVEIVEMDRMRKLIAEHMVRSKHTAPHVTSFVEADVTNLVMWRDKVKEEYLKRNNEKLTYTPIFVEAVVKAIKDFPMINISVDGTNLIVKKDINIGIATALPNGNLIVPVIKHADRYNMLGLTAAVNDLANRARNNKLKPDEIDGGTFTISNVGTFGNVMGTPIINQPQVAILAVGAIRKKPAVIETPEGDFIGIRHMMFLSLSYDHRVVDGFLGGSFVRKVADYLEGFDSNREI